MNKYNTKQHTCVECGGSFTGRKKKYCSKECSDEVRRRKNRERWRKQNPDWNKKIIKKCEWCGDDYSVPKRNAHQARFCSDECRYTYRSRKVLGYKPLEERLAIRREQKIKRQKKLEKERLERMIEKECAWCGGMFKTTNAMRLTCSAECSRKRANRIKWERKESRLSKKNTIDTDITLVKLYIRDNGICYICNEPCDYNDKQITDEGHFIAGETYPSIDHVIPIAKGGKHSWDNVKLAHHKCNGIKSDRIIRKDKALV